MAWGQQWAPYVSVAQRRAMALREMQKLRKKGKDIQPVKIEGRKIARSFWGKGWCDHLESFSDYENRLPRGRTYVRNGSVCHLAIKPGRIEGIVSGSVLYNIRIEIKKLKPATWKSVKQRCSGRIGSILELLQGKLSDQVMTVVTDREQGLFPQPQEIKLGCDCPDWAVMCKHVAAVLYGVGSRLDSRPELLFLLRDVDAQELISAEMTVPGAAKTGDGLDTDQLGDIFGIDLDAAEEGVPVPQTKPTKRRRTGSAKSKKKLPPAVRRQIASGDGRPGVAVKAKRKTAGRKKAAQSATNSQASTKASTKAPPRIRPTGKSVARLRGQLELSVTQFARQLNVSAASVYRWEATAGRLKLQAHALAALADLHQKARSG